MLKPFEILGKKFNKGFRGYEQQEVDKFLAQVVSDFETLYEENMELKEQTENTKDKIEQYQQLEKTMQNTLLIAQTTAEEIKTNAQKEKDLLIGEANAKVQQIMLELEIKAQDKKQQLQVQIDQKNQELENIKKLSKVSLAKIRTLLETELRVLNEDSINEYLKDVIVKQDDQPEKTQDNDEPQKEQEHQEGEQQEDKENQ